MPRKIIMLIATLFAVIGAVNAIDLTAVAVSVRMNPGYYHTLLDRFLLADTTLSTGEMSTLYYGYPFTPAYSPDRNHAGVARAYDSGDYDAALRMADSALVAEPLSLDLSVTALAAADRISRDGCLARRIVNLGRRCDLIATAILESGSGTTPRSPFLVTDPADIDRILRNVLGIDSIIDRTKVGDVLAIKVTFPGNPRRHILYFDASVARNPKR